MGSDATAVLAFGIDFGEGFEFPWGEEEFEVWYAAQKGVKPPGIEYTDATKPLFEAYWDARREANRDRPVDLETLGSWDYPHHVLVLAGHVKRVDWGTPEKISVETLKKMAAQDLDAHKIIEFCNRFNITMPHEPSVLIGAFWG